MDEDDLIQTELIRLDDRIVEIEALVRSLERRLDELADTRRRSDQAQRPVLIQRTPLPTGQGIDLEPLAVWVDWILQRYAATGDWLRPCWWRHGFVIEELAALRTAWMGVYKSDQAPESTAALKWHEEAAKCQERIRRAVATGPGCTAVSHRPDQSVTDDPRWSEEWAALRGGGSTVLATPGHQASAK